MLKSYRSEDDRNYCSGLLWDAFDVGAAQSLLGCVLVAMPANALIRTLSSEHVGSDRTPTFLDPDAWEAWPTGHPEDAKACLRTMEGAG